MEVFAITFTTIAVLSIVAGGTLSAFLARKPSRFVMWLSAYLVLIEGLAQLGFVIGWQQLGLPVDALAFWMFALFNLGNGAVIIGRWLKNRYSNARYIVYGGGMFILIAAIAFSHQALYYMLDFSWALVWFLALNLVIFVSTLTGLVLSARRKVYFHQR